MVRGAFLLTTALLITAHTPMRGGAQAIEGSWKISFVNAGIFEQTVAIVKLKIDGGKASGELVAAGKGFTLKSVEQKGNALHIVLKAPASDFYFDGPVPKKTGVHLLGTASYFGNTYPAGLSATGDDALDPATARRKLNCPPLEEARQLAAKAARLRTQMQRATDNDKKADLMKQLAEAESAVQTEYRKVLADHADSPAVFEAALSLMRKAESSKAKQEDVKGWAAAGAKAAATYGPLMQLDFAAQAAAALLCQEGFASLAMDFAKQAEHVLTPQTSASEQVRVLGLMARALRKTGKDDEAKTVDVRIAKIEEAPDKEYNAQFPGFKGEAFTGRKGKSDRAVFMELFTGAMCPPCVAADLAFDVLQKTYKPSELVLVQYHVHIPAPDPLSNPDTVARWNYYGKEVRGVPASLFNGKPNGGGGGGAANGQKKYEAYRAIIEPLLEEDAGVKLTVKAERDGDKVNIDVRVAGLADPGKDKKLRIMLAEETVRYVGGNKVRFHHNVVRAFAGSVEGHALTEAASKHHASIDLADQRGKLSKYLDGYEINLRPFSNPSRPLALNHLRVIAFVQDDATRDILQAVQVEVERK